MSQQAPVPDGKHLLSPDLGHIALLLEAILAELRYMRGLSGADEAFRLERSAEFSVPMEALQAKRKEIFG